ncbi:hypothetical protein D3C86_1723740 [compost metagenome]
MAVVLRVGQPPRASGITTVRAELGQLLQQAMLQLIEPWAYIPTQVGPGHVRCLAHSVPFGQQGLLYHFVRFDLICKKSSGGFFAQAVARSQGHGLGYDLALTSGIFDVLAAVPFAQGNLVGNGQALLDAFE